MNKNKKAQAIEGGVAVVIIVLFILAFYYISQKNIEVYELSFNIQERKIQDFSIEKNNISLSLSDKWFSSHEKGIYNIEVYIKSEEKPIYKFEGVGEGKYKVFLEQNFTKGDCFVALVQTTSNFEFSKEVCVK